MAFRNGYLALVATALTLPAGAAELVTLVEAIELSPSNIILPSSVNGTVTFLPCAGKCEEEHRRARLTPNTKFTVDGKSVKFDVFRQGLANLSFNDASYALISVDMQSLTITSIQISG